MKGVNRMKKVILMLCSVLVCCCLSVSATEIDEVKACEAPSDDKQVCTINKDGECECVELSINPTKIDKQEGGK